MSKLTKNQASIIFQQRTRMLKVKNNYKNGQNNLLCRMCTTTGETQQHIREECQGLYQDDSTKVTKRDLFNEEIPNLAQVAKRIIITINKLEHKHEWIENNILIEWYVCIK